MPATDSVKRVFAGGFFDLQLKPDSGDPPFCHGFQPAEIFGRSLV